MRSLLLACLVMAPGLVGCVQERNARGAAEEARLQFSTDDYCPLSRVTAVRTYAVPEAPPPIAQDPERLAMWNHEAESRAETDPRKTVLVSGCGDKVTYSCWAFPESSYREGIGMTCNAMVGSAQPAVTPGPSAPPPAPPPPGPAIPPPPAPPEHD